MFKNVETTVGSWLIFFIFLTIFWLYFLVDLMRKKDWQECLIFTGKIILTIPIFILCDAMDLWLGAIVSIGWWLLVFNKYK